jgi:hypothetical protein
MIHMDPLLGTASNPSVCRCYELTAGVCNYCAPPVPAPASSVTLHVTVPIEEAMRRIAEILREFAAKESGPVRERLVQIAEACNGSR